VYGCTFCHKAKGDVRALLAFPDDLFICDECVSLMAEIIAKDHPGWAEMLANRITSANREREGS
jgi:ATP-dependent protease Clp ATPase subunit